MRRPPLLAARVRRASSAEGNALLGPDHPLVRVTDALQSVIEQWLVVAALVTGSIAALIEGSAWAKPVTLGAAVVLAILTLLAAAFRQRKRDCSIDLILEGRETVPIAAVQHQRQRLLSKQTRRALARNVEEMLEQVSSRPTLQMRATRPLFDRRTVAMATKELLEVSRSLKTCPTHACGVARAERLITDAASPLYGYDVEALRTELRRILALIG